MPLQDGIPEGERNQTLFELARGFVNKGLHEADIRDRVHKVNEARCKPALPIAEVDALLDSACSYGARGYLQLPLAVFDSHRYKSLSHAARTVLAVAYRRYNGFNNGNIALPYGEFVVEFKREQTFYNARAEAVRSGLLRVSRKARYSSRGGKEPDLFEVELATPSAANQQRSGAS